MNADGGMKAEVGHERRAQWRRDFRKTLRDQSWVLALVCAAIVAIGAPLFALSDMIK